jgi:hypothetical protein
MTGASASAPSRTSTTAGRSTRRTRVATSAASGSRSRTRRGAVRPGAAHRLLDRPRHAGVAGAVGGQGRRGVGAGVPRGGLQQRHRGAARADARGGPDVVDARRASLHDLLASVDVANATGGQVVDPRTGEILKAEVNMYHNVMNLLRNWYFIQVSPLDRGRSAAAAGLAHGRLVEYVVAHEVGHAIGFPHNMKASAMYPADSIRSRAFLERMGGHVATLMDYSRFNYVAQPEDNIPPELLIPDVGPYDRFAIMWQNKPIPGARTPDDEWPRSTRGRACRTPSRGSASAPRTRRRTRSTSRRPSATRTPSSPALGMRNLERVMGSLLRVAERPGQDYTLLNELYGNAVRSGAATTATSPPSSAAPRRGNGTAPARASSRCRGAKQREAMRYLNRERVPRAGHVPHDTEILRRIEQEGVVNAHPRRAGGVLNSLLSVSRLNRLVEYEALAGPRRRQLHGRRVPGDLRGGVWTELTPGEPARRRLPPQPAARVHRGGGAHHRPAGPAANASPAQRPQAAARRERCAGAAARRAGRAAALVQATAANRTGRHDAAAPARRRTWRSSGSWIRAADPRPA